MEDVRDRSSIAWMRGSWKMVTGIVLAVGLAYTFFVPARRQWDTKEEALFRDAHIIGQALRQFADDHANSLPERLLDLAPKYVELSKFEKAGPFKYLGEGGRSIGVILYENPANPRPEGGAGGVRIVIVDERFVARHILLSELSRRLAVKGIEP